MMKYGMLIDTTKCINCGACTAACKNKYEQASSGIFRTEVRRYETGAFPHVTAKFRKTACNHCENPACVEICPVGAAQKMDLADGGMVVVDQEKCIGCGACTSACPFGVPKIDPMRHKNEKCSFCHQRVLNGKPTICSEACPTYAITYGERRFLMKQGLAKVEQLKIQGKVGANLYGLEETGILYVLDDDPGKYGLPAPGATFTAMGTRFLLGPLAKGWAFFKSMVFSPDERA